MINEFEVQCKYCRRCRHKKNVIEGYCKDCFGLVEIIRAETLEQVRKIIVNFGNVGDCLITKSELLAKISELEMKNG
jgi:hypothetical protein